jgi:hypothetical protein
VVKYGAFFWERLWRGSGVVFVVLTIVAFFVYGSQPKLGASPADLLSFFHGDRTRILIATVIFCFSFLELLWFGAALSSVLRVQAWPAGAPRPQSPVRHWGPSGSFV